MTREGQEIPLPPLEETGELTLAAWLKAPGDQVAEGEIIAEVLSDKVNVEIASPLAGRLVARLVAEGEVVVVGQPIARVMPAGASEG
jgi:pyruvate/2-oxoglutarate dehydrogenase complex dihydrolipoamide acyltransferase (E2) component